MQRQFKFILSENEESIFKNMFVAYEESIQEGITKLDNLSEYDFIEEIKSLKKDLLSAKKLKEKILN